MSDAAGGYGCRLRTKYFRCASCSTWVSSGSRLLSGRTRTTSELASAPVFGTESSAAMRSRQCARVFSQKICAVTLPPLAAPNKEPEIVALASATPRSSSSRKRLRSVFGAADDPGDVVLTDAETGQVTRLLAQRIIHDKGRFRHLRLLIDRGLALRRARRTIGRRLDVSRPAR